MSLFKRGGVFWSYFYIDGVRHQESTGTSRRRKAEIIEQKLKDEANAQRFQIKQFDPEITVAAIIAEFLTSGSATAYHKGRINEFLPFFGEMPAIKLTKALTDEYRRLRHAENKKLSDATINRDLSVLRRSLFWGLDAGLIPHTPLTRLRLVPERRKPRVILSVEEEGKLLTAASEHLKDIIVIALDAGLRRGELLCQRFEHIDFARKLLFVSKSKTPGGEAREIPLTERAYEVLVRRQQKEGLVFTYRGQPLLRLKTGWKGALKRAGLRHIRFHDLRHCFNQRLLESGTAQEIRMALMGHSTGRSINAVYTHVQLHQKREAISKLEAWIKQEQAKLQDIAAQQQTQNQGGNTNATQNA